MSDTIFTKIIAGEVPGHFVYQDDICVAILDVFPAVTGQTLVIPKQPEPYAFALDEATYQHIFMIAKKIATVLDTELATERTCLVVEGFEVPHTHIKLYPMPDTTPLGHVMPNQTEGDPIELAALAETLKARLC